MSAYDNTNRFTLSKNHRKEKESHPEYTGSINVNGQEFWLSAWVKEGRNGKFFSGSIRPKDNPQGKEPAVVTDRGSHSLDDDIPF